MNEERLNIIVAGKSGVGKSSFLNYLVGKDIFKTGIGDAVTQRYFDNIDFTDEENNINYRLYDTKGIEPNTTDECVNTILAEIEARDKSEDIFHWIHTVFYCFAAPSKRIEYFEVNFAKQLLAKGVSIVILLTKKDLVSRTDLQNIKNQIIAEIGNEVQVIPVCSVAEETRRGVSVKEGRSDVLKSSFLGLWEKMSLRLPSRYKSMFEMLNDGFNDKNLESEMFKSLSSLTVETRKIYEAIIAHSQNGIFHNGITLTSLRHYPALNRLFGVSSLDKEARYILSNLIENTITALSNLSVIVCSPTIIAERNANKKQIDAVFAFYKKVNKTNPKILYQHTANDAFQTMLDFDFDKRIESIKKEKDSIFHYFDKIASCWIFDREEKEDATRAFNNFHNEVVSTATDFYNLLENFITAYKAELHQYGQYCIRKDFSEGDCIICGELISLSVRQQIIKDVTDMIKKRNISEQERNLFLKDLLNLLNVTVEEMSAFFRIDT